MNDYDQTGHAPAGSTAPTTSTRTRRPRVRRLLSTKRGGWIVAAGVACAMAGFTGAGAAAAADGSPSAAATPTATASAPTGGGPVSGPATGGATGIVDTTSTSGFTMSTATGVEVTVDETSATKFHGASPRAVKDGASVLVLGTVDTATITATQVTVQPGGDGGAAAAAAAGVIPFQQGVPSPVKSVGQVPSDYTEGDGTIVGGTVAYRATEAAQAVVPGGINDRVVLLSDGEYEVHNISVNWPHHIFVSKDFKVLGYE
jgi:cytochrome c-type biogenesis protein CcmE